MDALQDFAQARGISMEELVGNTACFCRGITIGTNALINHQGVKTGIVATIGGRDATATIR